MLKLIKDIAEVYEVELTENAPRVAKARETLKCGLDKCICEPNNPERYCISPKCLAEIKETGTCHCRCYRKRDE